MMKRFTIIEPLFIFLESISCKKAQTINKLHRYYFNRFFNHPSLDNIFSQGQLTK